MTELAPVYTIAARYDAEEGYTDCWTAIVLENDVEVAHAYHQPAEEVALLMARLMCDGWMARPFGMPRRGPTLVVDASDGYRPGSAFIHDIIDNPQRDW